MEGWYITNFQSNKQFSREMLAGIYLQASQEFGLELEIRHHPMPGEVESFKYSVDDYKGGSRDDWSLWSPIKRGDLEAFWRRVAQLRQAELSNVG